MKVRNYRPRSYPLQHRSQTGKQSRPTLGAYDDATKRVQQLLAVVYSGERKMIKSFLTALFHTARI